MPAPIQLVQGAVGPWNVDELAETGVLSTGVKFSLDSKTTDMKAHLAADQLDQIVRSRTTVSALLLDFTGEAIVAPSGNGKLTGLANVYAGKNIAVCAHFAADVMSGDNVTLEGRSVFGFKRDASKYLQVTDPGIDMDPEKAAAITWKGRYLFNITHDAAAA